MQDAVTAGVWILAVVLVLAGAAKLRHPAGTATALAAARLPSSSLVVRGLGALELAVGVAVLTVGGPVPSLIAAAVYAGFTLFAAVHRRQDGASCGCFGAEASPLTGAHVVVDAAAAGVAVLGAQLAVPGVAGAGLSASQLLLAAALVGCGAWLVQLVLTTVPAWRQALALHLTQGGPP